MENSDRKITLMTDDDGPVEFYVLEETKIAGISYLLVTEEETDDGECYLLKDMSKPEDEEAAYEFVEDDGEMDYLFGIFSQLLEDMDVEIEK